MLGAQKIKTRERAKELRDLWRTPRWLFIAIEKYLGLTFTVDVACDASNALLPNFIGVEKDALVSSWGEAGTVAFLNPPYSAIGPWINAAIREKQAGVTTVMLIPMSLDGYLHLLDHSFAFYLDSHSQITWAPPTKFIMRVQTTNTLNLY